MTRLRNLTGDASLAALVVACAVPFVCLHPHYQPHVAVGALDADLSDFAILAIAATGLATGLRHGFAPLRGGRWVWVWAALFLLLILASTIWAHRADPEYSLNSNLISALKFAEYAFLAPAIPLALRRPQDRRAVYWAIALWSVVVTAIAVLQFFGVLDQFRGNHPVDREPSYLGELDFGAFSGVALMFAFTGLLLGGRRRLALVGGIAGGLGVALAAALDGLAGLCLSAVALWALARRRGPVGARRILAVAALVALIAAATFTLRGHAIAAFMRFLGIRPNTAQTSGNVQTWSQRVLLGYIGVEIWFHHPVLGVGWQESRLPHAFDPYLAGARKHYGKSQPPQAFPSPQHLWGVQNGIVQTLSDLGLVGFALLCALGWSAFALVIRVAQRGPPELAWESIAVCGWLIVGIAVFTGTGLLPGVIVDALLWLAIGFAVTLNHSLTSGS